LCSICIIGWNDERRLYGRNDVFTCEQIIEGLWEYQPGHSIIGVVAIYVATAIGELIDEFDKFVTIGVPFEMVNAFGFNDVNKGCNVRCFINGRSHVECQHNGDGSIIRCAKGNKRWLRFSC
jgi:hypothetical protein